VGLVTNLKMKWISIMNRIMLEMLSALDECAEYLDRYADVIDGDDGQPEANDAMRLLTHVNDTITKVLREYAC
jgi:hypothetical protein